MKCRFFGTDGIRGRVGDYPITPDFAILLGFAAGKVLSRLGTRKVLIGKDTRNSGYMLESALEAGFSAAGMNTILTGPLPTPAIAYLTRAARAEAGVVISASHNPYDDNGIKFFSHLGLKLPDEIELAIEAELAQGIECVASHLLGRASRMEDAAGRYIEFCKSTFPTQLTLEGLKVVVDCANGAAYQIAPAVLAELGAEVIAIGDSPNGLNINDGCGATAPAALASKVLEVGADIGLALDGDADRIILVDHRGQVRDGDHVLYILASEAQRQGRVIGGVVGTQMSNLGLELALEQMKIPFTRARVGDRYVMEAMTAKGWQLGGENSGHIICRDKVTTGDGMIAALQVLAAMVNHQTSLAELCAGMTLLPQVLINIAFKGTLNPLDAQQVQKIVASEEHRLGKTGRVVLRKSGTEPLLRVMVEGEDASLIEQSARSIADVVTQCCAA